MTRFITIRGDKEELSEEKYDTPIFVEFKDINLEVLEVFFDYREGARRILYALPCFIFITVFLFLAIPMVGMFLLVPIIILFVFWFLIWFYMKFSTEEFIFNTIENKLSRTRVDFGIERHRYWNLDDIISLECIFFPSNIDFINRQHYHIKFLLIDARTKIRFYSTDDYNEARDYCQRLSDFLGLKMPPFIDPEEAEFDDDEDLDS